MQLPAWNEALGLPRPWDQQWSLRMQQVLAFETDLLEYGDIFDGSPVVEAKTAELADAAWAELADVEALGGAFAAIDELKRRLVRSQAERMRRIETGEQPVVGRQLLHRDRAVAADGRRGVESILRVDHGVEAEQIADVRAVARAERDGAAVAPRSTSSAGGRPTGARANLMAATIALAHAGVTTGEWAGALREVFGEFRAPTGVSGGVGHRGDELAALSGRRTRALAERTGGPPRLLVGQARPRRPLQRRRADRGRGARRRLRGDLPGHPAHPGADRGSRRATRTSTSSACRSSRARTSSSCRDILDRLARRRRRRRRSWSAASSRPTTPILLVGKGVAAVYTPKDFALGHIMEDLVALAERQRDAATPG